MQGINFLQVPTDNQNFGGYTNTSNALNSAMALVDAYKNKQANSEAMQQQKRSQQLASMGLDENGQIKSDPEQMKALMSYRPPEPQQVSMPQVQGDPSLTGDIGNAYNVEVLAKKYGEKDPRVIAARNALTSQNDYQKSLQGYRASLADTAPKRASTTLGKTEQELDDIKSGFAPGTNRTQPISPEQQQQLIGQYNLAIQKNTTDSAARAKVLNATNIDKTLSAINPDALLGYSGAKGTVEKAADAAIAPFSQSKKYTEYTKSKAAADALATQVRQFYGDSIQPSMIARLEGLTNPESLGFTTEQAKENYNQIVNILKNETQTYRDALKGTSAYEGQGQQNSGANTDISTAPDDHIVTLKNGQQMTVAQYKKSKGIQ
jgi:hypothetical protein